MLVFPVNFPELESELPESVDLLEEEAAEMEMERRNKNKKGGKVKYIYKGQ